MTVCVYGVRGSDLPVISSLPLLTPSAVFQGTCREEGKSLNQ